MLVFDFDNYKEFVVSWISSQPKKGRGVLSQLATHLGVNSVVMSQIFRGDRHLSSDQALDVAEYIGLTEIETKYFLLLVDRERAGKHKLVEFIQKELNTLKVESQKLKKVMGTDVELSEQATAIFYSDWKYTAVRLASSLGECETLDEVAHFLDIERTVVAKILNFLLAHNLVKEEAGGLKAGARRTHLESGSPFIKNRQIQWRLKGFERMDDVNEDEMFFTAPMSISNESIQLVRREIVSAIERINKVVGKEKPNSLACLNIDLFRF